MTTADILDVRRDLRRLLRAEHGVPARGTMRGRAGPQIDTPFGSGTPVEGKVISTERVEPVEVPDAAFADGVQRFVVEAWVDGVPVVRAYAGAAIMEREDGALRPALVQDEEFVVTPLEMLPDSLQRGLGDLPIRIVDAGMPNRAHPLEDLRRCALSVESKRASLERTVCRQYQKSQPDRWLVIDGSLRGHTADVGAARRVGVIKSHETQFLAGADLKEAITLPVGHRTTVFMRDDEQDTPVMTWYVRLWEWEGEDLLFGLVRIERPPHDNVVAEAPFVSGWISSERAPVADDHRWDRLIYPMHRVEAYLRAQAGGFA